MTWRQPPFILALAAPRRWRHCPSSLPWPRHAATQSSIDVPLTGEIAGQQYRYAALTRSWSPPYSSDSRCNALTTLDPSRALPAASVEEQRAFCPWTSFPAASVEKLRAATITNNRRVSASMCIHARIVYKYIYIYIYIYIIFYIYCSKIKLVATFCVFLHKLISLIPLMNML